MPVCRAVVQFPLIGSTNAPDYLAQIAADGQLVTTAVLLDLIMITAILSIPVVLFPILKKHNETLARGLYGSVSSRNLNARSVTQSALRIANP